jgi:hypothetical protein
MEIPPLEPGLSKVYTEPITSFSHLKPGDEVAVINNGHNESKTTKTVDIVYSTKYYIGKITATYPNIIVFKENDKKLFPKGSIPGQPFHINNDDNLLTKNEQGYVRIYRKPVEPVVVAQEVVAVPVAQTQETPAPQTGGRTKRKRRKNKKSKRIYKRKRN